jgi:predicted metal-dependent HD superfamily phosphohydrolase
VVHGLTEIGVWAANNGAPQADVITLKKAFWFHDAVYGGSKDGQTNEEQSAQLWLASQLDSGAAADGPAALIRATDHSRPRTAAHRLQDVMLGVDLAILGQPDDVYDAYSRSVREEYSHVDDAAYRAGRTNILEHFKRSAHDGTLFVEPWFSDMYTAQALENVGRELAALS